jgi:hypothetical protein
MDIHKKALCVGINKFKNFPQYTLNGCVKDVADITALLKQFLGFNSSEIITLTDEQATKANIMAALKDMVQQAKAGNCNYLFMHLSTHGTQVPDQDQDEPDHADEAFVPHDIEQQGDTWNPDHIISDDELRTLFSQLPTENVMLEAFLDTCHSGTGLKAMDLLSDRKVRWIPPPSLDAFRELEGLQVHGLREGLMEQDMKNHVLFTGCRSDQTSADAHFGDTYNGAFTYYMCKVIKESQNGSTRTQNINKLRDYLKDSFSQSPQLECSPQFKEKPLGFSL